LGPEDYKQLLTGMNRARQSGQTVAEVDQYLQDNYGIGYRDLGTIVKRLPRGESAVKELTTKDMLRLEAYGLTLGWLDEIEGMIGALKGTGYEKARNAARKEIARVRRDYPQAAMLAMGLGGAAAGVGALGAAGTALNLARAGTGGAGVLGAVPSVGMAAGNPALMGATGAGVGGALGAGGALSGEQQQGVMGRAPGAMFGAAAGGAAGAGGAAVGGSAAARALLLKSATTGAAGAGGYGLLKALGLVP
jgi:hypothetical protein